MPKTIQYICNTPLEVSHKYITYILTHGGVLGSPTRKEIPSLGYFVIKHQISTSLLRGIAHAQNYSIHLQSHKVSYKYIKLHNIFFEDWGNIAYPYQNL
jgi:hypothetical protein